MILACTPHFTQIDSVWKKIQTEIVSSPFHWINAKMVVNAYGSQLFMSSWFEFFFFFFLAFNIEWKFLNRHWMNLEGWNRRFCCNGINSRFANRPLDDRCNYTLPHHMGIPLRHEDHVELFKLVHLGSSNVQIGWQTDMTESIAFSQSTYVGCN